MSGPLVEVFFRSFFGVRPPTPKMTKKRKSSGLVVAILHLSAQNGNPQKVGKVVFGPPGCPAGGEKWLPDSSQPPLEKHGRHKQNDYLFYLLGLLGGRRVAKKSRKSLPDSSGEGPGNEAAPTMVLKSTKCRPSRNPNIRERIACRTPLGELHGRNMAKKDSKMD